MSRRVGAGAHAMALLVVFSSLAWAGISVGDRAPAVRVATSTGGSVDTRALRGRVIVLNFWASWCQPCVQEAPVLSRAYRHLRQRGGVLVGLGDGFRGLPDAMNAAHGFGMAYPIALASPDLIRRYGVQALPFTVVIGRDGRVGATFEGSITDERLDAAVRAALAQR